MFLIDDDQAQIAERQVQRRTCADDHLRLARANHFPTPAAFGHCHTRMPFGGGHPEPLLNAGDEFRGERDFRQKHQRLPPLAQAFGHGL